MEEVKTVSVTEPKGGQLAGWRDDRVRGSEDQEAAMSQLLPGRMWEIHFSSGILIEAPLQSTAAMYQVYLYHRYVLYVEIRI